MGELGLIVFDLLEEFGGFGESFVIVGFIVEEIVYVDFNVSYVQFLGLFMGGMVVKYVFREIVFEWVFKVVFGDVVIGLGLIELCGGLDVVNLIFKVEKFGNGWWLNGEKIFMSFVSQVDVVVVFVCIGDFDGGLCGVSVFFVDLNQEGIKCIYFDDIGIKFVGCGLVFFDDVFVLVENMMVEQDCVFGMIMVGFDYFCVLIGLECLGVV